MNFTEIPQLTSGSDFTEIPKTEKEEFTNIEKMAIGLSLLGGVIFGIVIGRDTRTGQNLFKPSVILELHCYTLNAVAFESEYP